MPEAKNMLKTFEGVVPFVKRLATQTYSIDNWIFQLHYRVTFTVLMVSTILVCSRQYIGEHIHCIADKGVPEKVMNTYCFFTTTFTLVKDLDAKLLDLGNLPHPGVGAYGINSKDEIKRHAYYQWVPFVLFGQAIMFYLTHLLWKKLEGGRIKYLVDGLQLAAFSLEDKKLQVSGKNIPTKQDKEDKIKIIRNAFIERIYISGSWSLNLMFCEFLNFLNVILQIIITNDFLSGQFLSLGADVWREGLESSVDPLDEVFPKSLNYKTLYLRSHNAHHHVKIYCLRHPKSVHVPKYLTSVYKVTKCTFHKYGPSGSIQWHDAMCVMALNVINDKIYTFLWFWFIVLFVCTAMGLVWRFITILLHAKSKTFNKLVFANTCPGKINPWDVLTVSKYCSYTDWLFLKYISKNLDGLVFREIIIGLAEQLENSENSSEKSLLDSEITSKVENEYKIE